MRRFFVIGALVLTMALIVPAALLAFSSTQNDRQGASTAASESDASTETTDSNEDSDPKPWVGLYVMEVTERLAEKLEIDAEDGVAVVKVVEDGPADTAGIEAGDIIVSIGDSDVSTVSDVKDAVSGAAVGDTLAFKVERDGSESTYNVTVGERPAREGKCDCDGQGSRPQRRSEVRRHGNLRNRRHHRHPQRRPRGEAGDRDGRGHGHRQGYGPTAPRTTPACRRATSSSP